MSSEETISIIQEIVNGKPRKAIFLERKITRRKFDRGLLLLRGEKKAADTLHLVGELFRGKIIS
jgi:hypothetical protein